MFEPTLHRKKISPKNLKWSRIEFFQSSSVLWLFVLVLLQVGCIGSPSPLAPLIKGSIGVPHRGSLTGGASLPNKGDGFVRLRKHDVRWGNPRLIDVIKTAAAAVAKARPGGAPLLVGDISNHYGGAAEGHRSHRSGRDADLILYTLTPDGRSIKAPGFVNYGKDGLASHDGTFFRLDVERSWLLVKAMLTTKGADIQWLFVASWIEALLIEHARARGESDELVFRAENVLLQPGDSTPHADHFHVRIACTPEELVYGCAGGGPRWPWLPRLPQLQMTDEELITSLMGDLLPNSTPKGKSKAPLSLNPALIPLNSAPFSLNSAPLLWTAVASTSPDNEPRIALLPASAAALLRSFAPQDL